MSCVYFHSPSGEAKLAGMERALMGDICNRLMLSAFGTAIDEFGPYEGILHDVINTGWWTARPKSIKTAMRSSSTDLRFLLNGEEYTPWHVHLDTALAIGGDAIKLMARIHAQCEVHGYILGPNREWLASIIDGGLDDSIYREDVGWQEVSAFLRQDDREAVVMSYSVCRQFPNMELIGLDYEQDGEKWESMSVDERWSKCLEVIKTKFNGLELKPDGWDDYRFRGVTAFDILKEAVALSNS